MEKTEGNTLETMDVAASEPGDVESVSRETACHENFQAGYLLTGVKARLLTACIPRRSPYNYSLHSLGR